MAHLALAWAIMFLIMAISLAIATHIPQDRLSTRSFIREEKEQYPQGNELTITCISCGCNVVERKSLSVAGLSNAANGVCPPCYDRCKVRRS